MERTIITDSWFFFCFRKIRHVCACQHDLFWLKAWRVHAHVMIGSLRSSCPCRQWRRSFCSVCRLRAHATTATVKLFGVAQQHWLDRHGCFQLDGDQRWRHDASNHVQNPIKFKWAGTEIDTVRRKQPVEPIHQRPKCLTSPDAASALYDCPVSCADCRAVTALRCCSGAVPTCGSHAAAESAVWCKQLG